MPPDPRPPIIGHVSPDPVPRDPAREAARLITEAGAKIQAQLAGRPPGVPTVDDYAYAVLQAVTVEAQDAAVAFAHAVGKAAVRLAEKLRDATTVAECRAAGRDFLGELRAANKPPGPIISALVAAHRATTETP